jgi:hypothetical protein
MRRAFIHNIPIWDQESSAIFLLYLKDKNTEKES